MTKLPHLIGICGNPKSGKSLVQKFLGDYGVFAYDDGQPLRDFCVQHLGCTYDQVMTQEGKKQKVQFAGRLWEVRELLGEVGNKLEELFGQYAMPEMAMLKLDPQFSYSFGSVRREQGRFYKERGGIVIEVRNPQAPASPYYFDQFVPDAVTHVIENDALDRGLSTADALIDLKRKVQALVSSIQCKEEV